MATRTYNGRPSKDVILDIAKQYGMQLHPNGRRLVFGDGTFAVFCIGHQKPVTVLQDASVECLNKELFASIGVALSSVTDIKWPASVKWIDDHAFNGMDHLESVIGPTSTGYVREVGSCFSGLPSLKKVVLPNGVQSIGANAFIDCPKLEEISLPMTLSSISQSAFDAAHPIQSVNFTESLDIASAGVPFTFGTSAFVNMMNSFYSTKWPDKSIEYTLVQEADDIQVDDPEISNRISLALAKLKTWSSQVLSQAFKAKAPGPYTCTSHHFKSSGTHQGKPITSWPIMTQTEKFDAGDGNVFIVSQAMCYVDCEVHSTLECSYCGGESCGGSNGTSSREPLVSTSIQPTLKCLAESIEGLGNLVKGLENEKPECPSGDVGECVSHRH